MTTPDTTILRHLGILDEPRRPRRYASRTPQRIQPTPRKNRRRATRPAGPAEISRTEANILAALAVISTLISTGAFWLAMDARDIIITNGWM